MPTGPQTIDLLTAAPCIAAMLCIVIATASHAHGTDMTPSPGFQSLDGAWLVAIDRGDVGRTGGWEKPGGFPLRDAKPIEVPANIQEAFSLYNGVSWHLRTFVPAVATGADRRSYL